jgi:DNA-binding beta-propeller fold protein YncE
VSIKTESTIGGQSSLIASGISTAFKRVRYVPLLAYTLKPDMSEVGNATTGSIGDSGLQNIAFDGEYMWVGSIVATLSKIDIKTNTEVATLTLAGPPVALAFDGVYLWVGLLGVNQCLKVDVKTNTVVATVTTNGTNHNGAAFDGKHIWLVDEFLPGLEKIDINTNTVVATVSVGGLPWMATMAGGYLWVSDGAGFCHKVNVDTNTVVGTVNAGGGFASGLAFDGIHLWVGDYDQSKCLHKIDVDAMSVIASFPAIGDVVPAVTFDGEYLWALCQQNLNAVLRFDIETNSFVNTFSIGNGASDMMFDGTHIWVVNQGFGNLQKFLVRRN